MIWSDNNIDVNDIGVLPTYPYQFNLYVSTDVNWVGRYEIRMPTDTLSVLSSVKIEDDFNPYELMGSSGAVSFWDDPQEDIYSFEDGEAL